MKNREEIEQQPEENHPFDWKEEAISWLKILLVAAVIAFVVNTFIIANSRVPSGSMENTIMTGDRVIGFRLSYLFSDPERGDVVIFHWPDDPSGKTYFVKRVIGLPGDTVQIVEGKVYINGNEEPLDEPYLMEEMYGSFGPYQVPEDSYFMLGDNRNSSRDSRAWENKFVERDQLIAKVLFRYFPSIKKIQ